MKKQGRLFGIGVGPGDPELVSVKAVRILKQVSVIFAARSSKNSYSLAQEIISPHVGPDKPVIPLDFPMTRSREVLEGAWRRNAGRVLEVLERGEDGAFVTLGDPLIYSTFGYLMKTLKRLAPEVDIEVVPGISSFQAAAAASRTILAESEGSFAVVSGAKGGGKLRQLIDVADSIVVLKVYKHFQDIGNTLEELELTEDSVAVSRCGLEGERILKGLGGSNGKGPPYLTTLIVRKGNGKP